MFTCTCFRVSIIAWSSIARTLPLSGDTQLLIDLLEKSGQWSLTFAS
jgi:hypothetical protein